MIKPLLKVIPALSGNVKLACELDGYTQIGENEFKAISRKGSLYPLTSIMYQNTINVSLLNSSWEFDITKFYGIYKDIFYKNVFSYDKKNIVRIYNSGAVINDRNVDCDFGCKRVSYQKSNKQLNFFAPIYCDNVNDLPDYFEITINLSNTNLYNVTKKIRVDISQDSKNHLGRYLKRYYSKIDDNVIFLMPNSSQALYHGIDVQFGGFNKFVDNIISNNFLAETTINSYDAQICKGFSRNHLIMKQIIPLAFYFSVDDILTDTEKRKYKYATLKINGAYYKNGVSLPFYIFDDNYETLALPTKTMDRFSGKFVLNYNYSNLLDINDHLSLSSNNVEEYKYSNKLVKFYNRWMLKYSPIDNPYITNTNYLFSANQKLQNLYYQYPQNYYWSNAICAIERNCIDLKLPIGSNINNYYTNHEYSVDRYYLAMNNYISNWFDVTNEKSIDYIIENTDWGDVHSDGKIFYKGLLYDFNKIYRKTTFDTKVDKFAILYYINDSELFDDNTIKQYVLANKSMTYVGEEKGNVYSNILTDTHHTTLTNDAEIISKTESDEFKPNYLYELNQYFTYNTSGTGKYVKLSDIQTAIIKRNNNSDQKTIENFDIYKHGIYYKIKQSEIAELLDNAKYEILKPEIIEAFELLEIPYISNVSDILNSLKSCEDIYYSLNNHNDKSELQALNIANISDINKTTFYNCLFYAKGFFVHSNALTDVTNIDANGNLIKGKGILLASGSKLIELVKENDDYVKYIFNPIHELDNNKIVNNIFIRVNDKNKFYGNYVKYNSEVDNKYLSDNNVLYIDDYNIIDSLNNYYILTGNMYIKHIGDNYIVLSDIITDKTIQLYVYNEEDKNELLKECSYTYSYIANYANKYEVKQVITSINAITISEQHFDTRVRYTSQKLVRTENVTNPWDENEVTSYITNTSYTTAYTYVIDKNNILIKNIVNTAENVFRYNSSINLNAYTYSVNYDNCNIVLNDYSGKVINLHCKNKLDTYTFANKCAINSYVKLSNGSYTYMNNYNGIGTYFPQTFKSSMFKHPQQVIKSLHNVGYITTNGNIININIPKNATVELVSYNSTINNNVVIYNPTPDVTDINLRSFFDTHGFTVDEDNVNEYRYARILSNEQLNICTSVLSPDINNYYIKLHCVNHTNDNIKVSSEYIKVKNLYDSELIIYDMSKYFSFDHEGLLVLQNTINTNKYNLTLKSELSQLSGQKFELYYKKQFKKLTKDILEKIIGFNTDDKYTDIYIYRNENDNDISNNINYVLNSDVDTNILSDAQYCDREVDTDYISLTPFFDSVYKEEKQNTVFYKSYILNTITESVFVNTYDNTSTTLYRYNMPDEDIMYDVSYYFDPFTGLGCPSHIYNEKNTEVVTYSYQYTYNGNQYIVYDPERTVLKHDYAYYSSIVPTYDKHEIKSNNFIRPDNYRYNNFSSEADLFEMFKLNTYTYNNITYGFYLLELTLSNINTLFNISFPNLTEAKYFTHINGINIINNHKYLTDMFKYIVPYIKYNVLNNLYNIPILNSQYKTTFNKKYVNTINKNVKHVVENKEKNATNTITLYRYYDNIIPYIYETNNVYTDYMLKTTGMNYTSLKENDTPYYSVTNNIYNYLGIRKYNNFNKDSIGSFEYIKQLEYKYYNDNQFINTETEFNIYVSDNITANDILYYQQDSVIIEYFRTHVNKFKLNKFTDNEILFLYNKYSVIILTNPVKIGEDNTKIYTLTYKFTLN